MFSRQTPAADRVYPDGGLPNYPHQQLGSYLQGDGIGVKRQKLDPDPQFPDPSAVTFQSHGDTTAYDDNRAVYLVVSLNLMRDGLGCYTNEIVYCGHMAIAITQMGNPGVSKRGVMARLAGGAQRDASSIATRWQYVIGMSSLNKLLSEAYHDANEPMTMKYLGVKHTDRASRYEIKQRFSYQGISEGTEDPENGFNDNISVGAKNVVVRVIAKGKYLGVMRFAAAGATQLQEPAGSRGAGNSEADIRADVAQLLYTGQDLHLVLLGLPGSAWDTNTWETKDRYKRTEAYLPPVLVAKFKEFIKMEFVKGNDLTGRYLYQYVVHVADTPSYSEFPVDCLAGSRRFGKLYSSAIPRPITEAERDLCQEASYRPELHRELLNDARKHHCHIDLV